MAIISAEDKMRIQTLREQGLGARKIKSRYPDKKWSLAQIHRICKRVDETGSSLQRKPGSGRPKTARTAANITAVETLICSQEGQPGTSRSTRQISRQIGVSRMSVARMAKEDLRMKSFKRVPAQVITAATQQKRLQRSTQLLRRMSTANVKQTFFTDEKLFYVSPPVNSQNNRVWSAGLKRDINPERLLLKRAKFSASVMVSAGVCYGGKGKLHFVDEKAKINADYYVTKLLPKLFEDCEQLLPAGFIFQQDGAPAHSSHQAQDWIESHNPAFIPKDQWPPNSPDLNPLDYHVWGAMLDEYQKHTPKPTSKAELKVVLQTIWDNLSQAAIDRAILAFRKRLQACIASEGRHFEHLLR